MIDPAEEYGKEFHLQCGLVDLEIVDEAIAGHRAKARPDLRVLGAAMGMTLEVIHIIQRLLDAGHGPGTSAFRIISKALISLSQIVFNEKKVAPHLYRRTEFIGHALVSSAPASQECPI